MAHELTEVYRYLTFLDKYLLGDLQLFHKLAQEAEQREAKGVSSLMKEVFGKFLDLFTRNATPTATITTTHYPYSFEFMFGSPVISRSTIPHTSTLFSTIDILGFLNRTEPNYRQTTKNFESFFELVSPSIDSTELSILTKVYRHGLTHNYFPKLGMEISYHSSNQSHQVIFKNQNGDLVLNVNILESIVLERLSTIKDNASLYSNMNNQYRILIEGYERECRPEIDILKARL